MRCTIIVPFYNAETTLERCLASIAAQTVQSWECLCVDDGSTDASASLVERLTRADDRFRLIRKANGGVASARNAGLDAAQGEYILFVDADDGIAPDCLNCLDTDKNADIIIFNIGVRENQKRMYAHLGAGLQTFESLFEQFRLQYIPKLYRRAFLDAHALRFVPLMVHEDELFYSQALLLSDTFQTVDRCLYYYIYNADSLTNAPGRNILKKRCRLLAALRKQDLSSLAEQRGASWKEALDLSCLVSAQEALCSLKDREFRSEALELGRQIASSIASPCWKHPRWALWHAIVLFGLRHKSRAVIYVARRVGKWLALI